MAITILDTQGENRKWLFINLYTYIQATSVDVYPVAFSLLISFFAKNLDHTNLDVYPVAFSLLISFFAKNLDHKKTDTSFLYLTDEQRVVYIQRRSSQQPNTTCISVATSLSVLKSSSMTDALSTSEEGHAMQATYAANSMHTHVSLLCLPSTHPFFALSHFSHRPRT
jgi:hypothetical protein